jgi:hypothetical protein
MNWKIVSQEFYRPQFIGKNNPLEKLCQDGRDKNPGYDCHNIFFPVKNTEQTQRHPHPSIAIMSEVFKKLVGVRVVIAVYQLEGFIFAKQKDYNAGGNCKNNGKQESDAEIIRWSFVQQG